MYRLFVTIYLIIALCAFSFAQTDSDLNELYEKGNYSYSSADYISSAYYYQRMLDSDGWTDFPQRIDVLRKLAMIEESQAQFDRAVDRYRRLIEILPSTPQPNNDRNMRSYYMQRYAENLERIGLYRQANKVLWELVRNSDSTSVQLYLISLVQNCAFQTLSESEIEELRSWILPKYLDTVGWEFANLLYRQNKFDESLELFDQLLPLDPIKASEFSSTLIELYTSADRFDELINRIHSSTSVSGENGASFILLETNLLEEAGQAEEALKRLEEYIFKRVRMEQSDYAERLIALIPSAAIERWIDLIVRFRGNQPGIQVLSDILKRIPMDMQRRKKLADLFVKDGRTEEAVSVWKKWAETQTNTPMAVLNAAQEIFALDDAETASELLNGLKDRIPPQLAWKQGQAALQFGDYPAAMAAFEIAVASGGIPISMISSVFDRYIQSETNHDELMANLIQSASGRHYSSIPPWIKTSLQKLGVRPEYRERLMALADADDGGAWKYNIACEALRRDSDRWALDLLSSIPPESLYRVMADRKRAEILGENSSIVAQREAADLMFPSVEPLLSATPPVVLNPVLMDRLIKYSELRLNAFQPNEALVAIQLIESSSASLERTPQPTDFARIAYGRARALSELASLEPAIKALESIDVSPYREDAQILLARIYIAQRKIDLAVDVLNDALENPQSWRIANDALSLLSALEPLVGDALEGFSDAILYELQGRFDRAVPCLRQVAVDYYGGDVEEWTRYYIGRLKNQSGETEDAREELQRLLMDVDDPIVRGLTRMELLKLNDSASASIGAATEYQELLIDLPNTLFADLARLQMQRKFGKEQP